MLHLGSTYLYVKDMEKSIEFYKKLLGMEPTAKTFDRWAQFNFEGKCIALNNNKFDRKKIDTNKNYIEYYEQRLITYGNNIVLNFWIVCFHELVSHG